MASGEKLLLCFGQLKIFSGVYSDSGATTRLGFKTGTQRKVSFFSGSGPVVEL